jgi:hypothetical protein
MNTHGFARITVAIFASLIWGSTQPCAQGGTPEITVLSVLTLAKEQAEKAENEFVRNQLRARVVHSIIGTGKEAAFSDYVAQVRSAKEAKQPSYAPGDEDLRFNWNVAERAKQAFLLGYEGKAREILRECRVRLAGSWCGPSDTFFFSEETFIQNLLLGWEIETERFQAALQRLKTAAWPADFYQYLLVFIGPRVAGVDIERRLEIERLVKQSGLSITECLVDESSIFPHELAPKSRTPRPTGKFASLRKLACEGKAETALEMARSFGSISERTRALAEIAEGLAGVPGFAQDY